jgi:class 3 adenylate cyclase/tetratricopeptide (TPR) repeat protein
MECGGPVAAASAPHPSPAVEPAGGFVSPRTYTPPHLAERILTSRTALEGERKQVTVLFADLKGSMELLADRDPEEARAILDPVLEHMMEAVHRYEGTVNQVMGDGIMALFGAPLAREDHAVRACYAALRMQEAVQQSAEELLRTQGVRVQIRVGLNSGEVVVRAIGSDLRMDYTAVGQTTHLAARMEQLATPGTILLAPDTLRLAEGYVQVKPLGPTAVKGLAEPIAVYELVGAGLARSRLQAAAARGLTKFVGRDGELETLRRTLDQAGSGRGQIVAIMGEPGVGKSRLVWEFGHSHRTAGWLVLETRSVSYGRATSYLPVIDLLKSYFGIEARDDPRRVREKVAGKVLTLEEDLRPVLTPLLALLDVPLTDSQWEALDPTQRRQRILEAVKRLLLRESQEQPVLLVCEDLHWIDSETQALLDSLVESLPTARLLLLVNYRPEYEHHWGHKTYHTQLRLDPLPPESAEALLGALLGADPALAPLKRRLIARAEGNPFFVEESVRTLVESGVLVGERGSYRLLKPFESTQVPATVQAVLAARIDRLAPEDKRLLQAAAVIGKDLPYPLLQAIAELPSDALREGLARLQMAEFLYETSLFPDLEYTFKHALTHEVAYGSLLQGRRRALHARIVTAMESVYAERAAEQAERLAHHALRAELWEKAVTYERQAGAKSEARSAHRQAAAYLEQAIMALEHLPDTAVTRRLAIDLRLELDRSLLPLAELPRAHLVEQDLEGLAEALGDPLRLARVHTLMIRRYRQAGDYERCVEFAERALALASAVQDKSIQHNIMHQLGLAYFWLGSYRAALGCFRQVMKAPPVRGPFDLEPTTYPVVARAWAAACLADQGELAEGTVLAEQALQAAAATQLPWDLAMTLQIQAELHLCTGAFARAVPVLERGVALCESAELVFFARRFLTILAYAYALTDRVAEALGLLDALVQRADAQELSEAPRRGASSHVARRIAYLSEAYLLTGRLADARETATSALARTRQQKERSYEAWALRVLGDVALHADSPESEQAEAHYRQALTLADELGMRPLVAHCHLGLGTLYQKMGRDEDAQAQLTTAAEMYRAMEMPFWLAKAEAALGQKVN